MLVELLDLIILMHDFEYESNVQYLVKHTSLISCIIVYYSDSLNQFFTMIPIRSEKLNNGLNNQNTLKGLAMIFAGQKNPFITFRSKERYIIFKKITKSP